MTDTNTNTTTIAGVRSPSRLGRGAGLNLERACLFDQAEAGHRLREQLRVRKLPRSQVVVQLVRVAHGYDDTIKAQKSKGAKT